MGLASITSRFEHVTDEGTQGSIVLCELFRDFRPIISPSCEAEVSRPERGSRYALIVVDHVFTEAVWAEVGP